MFIGAVNAEDKDWVETVNFGSIQQAFKLDNRSLCIVLPKVVYDEMTTKPLQPSLERLESCFKTCIRPVESAIESGSILDGLPEVFQGLECLPGKYHISVDPSVPPVVRPLRRVSHSKPDPLTKELDRMEDVGIIETDLFVYGWILKTVILPLKENTTPLAFVADITTSRARAPLFSTLDAEKAFCQNWLDEESSKFLTFNIPSGRYRYLRMSMGITSDPEVY